MDILKTIVTGAFVVSACLAQTINISGKVTDIGSTPISGANVKLENAGLTTTTGADGSFNLSGIIGINFHINRPLSRKLSITINDGLMTVHIRERSTVKINAYTIQGKAVSAVQQTMDVGTYYITQPFKGSGVYFYAIQSGDDEFVLKSPSFGAGSQATAAAFQVLSFGVPDRRAQGHVPVNDLIAVTKNGYLNYRVKVTKSDTSGIEIKMIVCAGTMTDIDGNFYQAAKIGNQVWTVENLKTTRYNDGSAIPLVTNNDAWTALTTPGFCWFNNDSATHANPYGALYNWYAVNTGKLAPAGWHVPADSEWSSLTTYLGGESVAGGKLKETGSAHWFAPNAGATNETGFSALPGGFRYAYGAYLYLCNFGNWWSSTALDATVSWSRYLYYNYPNVNRFNYNKFYGLSVRCVRN